MDRMCKKSEVEGLNNSFKSAGETDKAECGSPVFKCATQTKPVRESILNSSDYDLPSYQINQSMKSRASSKCGSETNESILPFSPAFSPIPVARAPQFQPPSIHSLGTVNKNIEKSAHIKFNSFSVSNKKELTKPGGVIESLGVLDKDISWVSSMASPPPKQIPGSEFNTVEKATFLPEENFQSIQPRALFSPTFDDDFGCQPIEFTPESDDDDEPYKSNVRLSDVCATLKQLEFKSLDQVSNNSVEKTILGENSIISPVIKTKRRTDSVKKKKKGALVVSPPDKYEFSVGENLKVIESDKVLSKDGSHFIEDDSFQSMSFSCIDELCKTLVTDQSNSSVTSKASVCDKTLVNGINMHSKPSEISKKFYSTKAETLVNIVSSLDNLHSNAKALEEGNKYIPTGGKIDQSYADKGIVRLDVFNKEFSKSDATKRLHSEVSEEKDESSEKKFKTVDDWGNVKQYLSESQLNVSDGEIFKTVEILEKTLASQERREMEKLSGKSGQVTDEEASSSQNSVSKISGESSGKSQKQESSTTSKQTASETWDNKDSCKGLFEVGFPAFTTASGSKISVSEKALNKAREILRECEENAENTKADDCQSSFDTKQPPADGFVGFSTCSGKEIKISAEALAKAKAFMQECEVSESYFKQNQLDTEMQDEFQKNLKENLLPSLSGEATEMLKNVAECDGSVKARDVGEEFSVGKNAQTKPILNFDEKAEGTWMKGFATGTGKPIKVSAESLEKAKALMLECEEENLVKLTNIEEIPSASMQNYAPSKMVSKVNDEEKPNFFEGFSTGSGKSIQVSAKALEKAKLFFKSCEDEFEENFDEVTSKKEPNHEVLNASKKEETPLIGFSTALGKKVQVSSEALEKAKALWLKTDENVYEMPENSAEPEKAKPPTSETKKREEISRNENSETNEAKGSKTFNREEQLGKTTISEADKPEDWNEIIPSWLHAYTTSPSMISEGLELSPKESCEAYKEHIIKSPVLGPSDRFCDIAKSRKHRFRNDDKNRTPSEVHRNTSTKRALNLDFSAPFKRIKIVEESPNVNVKEERARAREEQEKIIREKQKVKPSEGSHLKKKLTEKQISWVEAVGKSFPEAHSDELLKSLGVQEDVLRVNIESSKSFKFNGEQYFGLEMCRKNTKGVPAGDSCYLILDDENNLGVEEFKRAFLASPEVQPNLVPSGWVENHYKWIVWKLAHYERSFPLYFGGICLTPSQVLFQLKYRYDREIDRSERSALRKILERDDSSVKRLVLCVCGIKKVANGYELELTDGWYSCPAHVDVAMSRLIDEGKLAIGTKLMTQGAVVVNCEQGVSPLEVNEGVYLKISTNSTRRVRWDTKLGFQKNPENFPISLGSILPLGGQISRIDVIIVRIYPMLFMEKTDGHHVTRNMRAEEKAEAEYRRIQEQQMEIIYNEIRTEMRRCASSDKKTSKSSLGDVETGDNLRQLMEDPITFQNLMLTDHKKLIDKLQANEKYQELAKKIEKKLEKEKLKKRIVSQFLRVKIVDFRKPDYNNPALLSVWNPGEDLTTLFTEGKVVSVMNVTLNNSSRLYKPLQINTTRQTQFRLIAKNVNYPARNLTQLKNISSSICPAFEEVDLVGMVALIQDVSYGSRLSQIVYLTDLEMNFVGIVFWGSCKDFGWEHVLRIKSIVACSNLQWKKSYTHQDVPSVYVNENSVFTENPKQSYLKEEIERLRQNLPEDMTDFLSKCEEDLTAKLEDSKWRTNTSKNSSNESSLKPQTPKADSGFESKPTASSTPIKPFTFRSNSDGAEPSPIQKRIEKLQSCGEPSSLIPLLIRNNMKRKFKKRVKPLSNQSAG